MGSVKHVETMKGDALRGFKSAEIINGVLVKGKLHLKKKTVMV